MTFGVLAPACTTTNGSMSALLGRSRAEVLSRWGAPDSETALRDGRSVTTWVSQWGLWILGSTCRQSFTYAADQTVEAWSYSGCPPVQTTKLGN